MTTTARNTPSRTPRQRRKRIAIQTARRQWRRLDRSAQHHQGASGTAKDTSYHPSGAQLQNQIETLWDRLENAWVNRLNVVVEAIVGRVEHLEESMGATFIKLREEIAARQRTQREASPYFRPQNLDFAPKFQTIGLRGAPYLDNTLVYENRQPPTFLKGWGKLTHIATQPPRDSSARAPETMDGIEHSTIKVTDSKWNPHKGGTKPQTATTATQAPTTARTVITAPPAVPVIIDLTTQKSTDATLSKSARIEDITYSNTGLRDSTGRQQTRGPKPTRADRAAHCDTQAYRARRHHERRKDWLQMNHVKSTSRDEDDNPDYETSGGQMEPGIRGKLSLPAVGEGNNAAQQRTIRDNPNSQQHGWRRTSTLTVPAEMAKTTAPKSYAAAATERGPAQTIGVTTGPKEGGPGQQVRGESHWRGQQWSLASKDIQRGELEEPG
ncbi:hypothetical protein BDZ91DRAFT_762905 [Kalaharituber pfeilii]|nr:hypothetical protein BDZ91DRAFT_762905 [Kalaharituber pfeilii]